MPRLTKAHSADWAFNTLRIKFVIPPCLDIVYYMLVCTSYYYFRAILTTGQGATPIFRIAQQLTPMCFRDGEFSMIL